MTRRSGTMLDSADLVAFHLSHGGSAVVVEEKPLLGAGVKAVAVDGTPPIIVTQQRQSMPGVRVTTADGQILLIVCRLPESAQEILELAHELAEARDV